MTDSTQASAEEILLAADEDERSKFLAQLQKAIDMASEQDHTVGIVLLDEVDKPVIYPPEQVAKSILADVTQLFRESSQSNGPMPYWGFDRIALIESGADAAKLKTWVKQFLKAADHYEFCSFGEEDSRAAKFVAGIAVFPADGATASDVFEQALKNMQ